jgi:hypothetical protein
MQKIRILFPILHITGKTHFVSQYCRPVIFRFSGIHPYFILQHSDIDAVTFFILMIKSFEFCGKKFELKKKNSRDFATIKKE